MAGWTRRESGQVPVYQADALAALPGVVQGFTTRHGGVSPPPFHSLNLGAHVGDDPAFVTANRGRLWDALGFQPRQVALAEQVHGSRVAVVEEGGLSVAPAADALVTNHTGLLLMLFFADCVPVYIVDPATRAIALTHSGWRGTVVDIAAHAVAALRDNFGTRPETCLAAIGPCIGGESYEVGPDVAGQFPQSNAVRPKDGDAGAFTLDLRRVIHAQLIAAGLRAECISACDEDTFRNGQDFFSFRRDGRATGRLAGFLALRDS